MFYVMSKAEQRRRGLVPKPSLSIYCFCFDVFISTLKITRFVQFAQASLWSSLVSASCESDILERIAHCISSSNRLPAKWQWQRFLLGIQVMSRACKTRWLPRVGQWLASIGLHLYLSLSYHVPTRKACL